MDLWLVETAEGTQLCPKSVHGMLWLQTHFENEHWEAIANNQLKIPLEDAEELFEDASEAGVMLNLLPALSVPGKF